MWAEELLFKGGGWIKERNENEVNLHVWNNNLHLRLAVFNFLRKASLILRNLFQIFKTFCDVFWRSTFFEIIFQMKIRTRFYSFSFSGTSLWGNYEITNDQKDINVVFIPLFYTFKIFRAAWYCQSNFECWLAGSKISYRSRKSHIHIHNKTKIRNYDKD